MMRSANILLIPLLAFGCDAPSDPLALESPSSARPLPAAAQSSTQKVPIDAEVLDVAAEACVGEPILFQLREEMIIHETIDARGRQHFHLTFHDKGTKGIGVQTGAVYHLTGAAVVTQNSSREFTVVFNSNYIGKGEAPNWIIQVVSHVTQNARGDFTAEVEHVAFKCQA